MCRFSFNDKVYYVTVCCILKEKKIALRNKGNPSL